METPASSEDTVLDGVQRVIMVRAKFARRCSLNVVDRVLVTIKSREVHGLLTA